MKAYLFAFIITTPDRQFSTKTVRDTDNVEAAMKEIWVLYPDASEIRIVKHYRLR